MMLHAVEQGAGDRVVVLLHGMMGFAQSWWRVSDLLEARGCRVLALDLPGHGLSERDSALTVERAADAVVKTVAAHLREPPAVAVGHSFGDLVLAAASPQLRPGLSVYVDAPFTSAGGHDRSESAAEYERDRTARTVDGLRLSHPHYSDRDCLVEAIAAERFDADTAAAVASASGGTWMPRPGSIVVRADPSDFISDADASEMEARGVLVRSIPGAAHSVWYSHFDEFVRALPEVFAMEG